MYQNSIKKINTINSETAFPLVLNKIIPLTINHSNPKRFHLTMFHSSFESQGAAQLHSIVYSKVRSLELRRQRLKRKKKY